MGRVGRKDWQLNEEGGKDREEKDKKREREEGDRRKMRQTGMEKWTETIERKKSNSKEAEADREERQKQ